jgi:hypothetical protein
MLAMSNQRGVRVSVRRVVVLVAVYASRSHGDLAAASAIIRSRPLPLDWTAF